MQRIELVSLAAQPEMPWANGGGTTRQVAIDPPTATLATGFRWRVSRARVASDGPFSRLPGVDRSLWLLHGAGVRLEVDGREVVLDQPRQRFDFAGEAPVTARLLAGPIEDLNVMVARDRVRARATIVELAAGPVVPVDCAQRLLLVLAGTAAVTGGPTAAAGDALRIEGLPAAAIEVHAACLLDLQVWPG